MRKQKVLLIEDDDSSQLLFGTAVRQAGYEVLEARTPEAGLRRLRDDHPDVVVVDVGVPGMDVFETIQWSVGADDEDSVPVLIATVRTGGERLWGEEGTYRALAPGDLLAELSRLLEPTRRALG